MSVVSEKIMEELKRGMSLTGLLGDGLFEFKWGVTNLQHGKNSVKFFVSSDRLNGRVSIFKKLGCPDYRVFVGKGMKKVLPNDIFYGVPGNQLCMLVDALVRDKDAVVEHA